MPAVTAREVHGGGVTQVFVVLSTSCARADAMASPVAMTGL